MNQKTNLYILAFLILVTGGFLYFSFIKKPASYTPELTPSQEQVIIPTISINPTTEVETRKVLQEGGTIPFDYEVISVGGSAATIKGLKGEMTITNNPIVKYFFKKAEEIEPASFSNLKVGQKLMIEINPPPEKEIKVYIVGE